ncbi:MAG: RimK-like protein [bacterium]|nr:RimK-like protein [bacterium]
MPPKRNVLILGDRDDEHAAHVQARLADTGHNATILDTAEYPSALALSYSPQTNSARIEFPDGQTLDWSDIYSIYWRQFNGVGSSILPDSGQASIAENDSRSLVESMLLSLDGKWVNSYRAWRLHQVKPAQLARVCSLHLDPVVNIPRTLLTNSPGEFRDFATAAGPCIFKPVQGGAHTRILSDEYLSDDHLDNLQHAPVTVQQYVEGTDIRVFIAGQKVMACSMVTDALDFREDPNVKINPHTLSPDLTDACIRIAGALDLVWTGIDLRLTEKGEYFFFEANPSPMFLGFQSRCDLPLSESLIDLLVK